MIDWFEKCIFGDRFMKSSTYIFIAVVFFTQCTPSSQVNTGTNDNPDDYPTIQLSGDSGFITKKIGLPFLIANELTDTAESFWDQINDGDTIAKYYRDQETQHFVYCSFDLSRKYSFTTHLIMELDEKGEILEHQRYLHGNYPCCWNKTFDGFKRYGDGYGIKICGTGSGYCASYLFLFKKIIPQDSQYSIPVYY
jgi:hypothetical protein